MPLLPSVNGSGKDEDDDDDYHKSIANDGDTMMTTHRHSAADEATQSSDITLSGLHAQSA